MIAVNTLDKRGRVGDPTLVCLIRRWPHRPGLVGELPRHYRRIVNVPEFIDRIAALQNKLDLSAVTLLAGLTCVEKRNVVPEFVPGRLVSEPPAVDYPIPDKVLLKSAAPLPVVAEEDDRPHISLSHFVENDIEPFEHRRVKLSRFRLKGRSHTCDAVEQSGALGSGHQAEIRHAVGLEMIEFPAKPLDAASAVLLEAEKRAVPVIGTDEIVRLAASVESGAFDRHEWCREHTGRRGNEDHRNEETHKTLGHDE